MNNVHVVVGFDQGAKAEVAKGLHLEANETPAEGRVLPFVGRLEPDKRAVDGAPAVMSKAIATPRMTHERSTTLSLVDTTRRHRNRLVLTVRGAC